MTTNRLSKGMNAGKTFIFQLQQLHQSFAGIADDAGSMGFIYYQVCAVLFAKGGNVAQRRHIPVHRVHRFYGNKNITRSII